MTTIDYYILRKTIWPLSAAIGIVLVALLLERLVRLLDLVVNQGGPFFLLLKMLINLVPTYLGLALPAAFFVGVLMAAIRLSSDSELDAIQASGVGLFRLLIPIMGFLPGDDWERGYRRPGLRVALVPLALEQAGVCVAPRPAI